MLKDFEAFLKKNNVWHEFLEKDDTATAEKAGKYVDNIAKTIVFEADDFFLVILPGPRKVSRKKLRPLVGRENIKLASPEDVLHVTGFEVGAVPPIGHKQKLKCVLDERIVHFNDVWAGGGSVTRLVHLKVSDIIKFNNPIVADVSE